MRRYRVCSDCRLSTEHFYTNTMYCSGWGAVSNKLVNVCTPTPIHYTNFWRPRLEIDHFMLSALVLD